MNRPEPIELENNLGPDAVTGEINRVPWMAYDVDEMDIYIAEKDKEIAELKAALERDFVAKKSAEKVLRDLLDCGLIKEWFYNGTFHAVLKADDPHLEIAELKQKLEDVNEIIKTARQMLEDEKATLYTENERLKEGKNDYKQFYQDTFKELESLKASHYAEMVDAGMRERRLRSALWLARAELCRRLDVDRYLRKHRNSWYNENYLTFNDACVAMEVKVCDAESKCRAKAKEFK